MVKRKKKEVLEELTKPILEEEPEVFVGYTQVVEEVIQEPKYHIIKNDETLEEIAKKYGITVLDLNKLNNYAIMMPGNQIRVK